MERHSDPSGYDSFDAADNNPETTTTMTDANADTETESTTSIAILEDLYKDLFEADHVSFDLTEDEATATIVWEDAEGKTVEPKFAVESLTNRFSTVDKFSMEADEDAEETTLLFTIPFPDELAPTPAPELDDVDDEVEAE